MLQSSSLASRQPSSQPGTGEGSTAAAPEATADVEAAVPDSETGPDKGRVPGGRQEVPGSSHGGRHPAANDVRRLQLVRGQGQYVYGDNGVEYIDCVSGDVPLGHNNNNSSISLLAAAKDAASSPGQLNGNVGLLHPSTVELARRLVSTLPSPLSACFFVNSQSEANDLALNMAFCAAGSEEVVCLDRAEHGKTLACLRLCKDRAAAFAAGTGNGKFGFGSSGCVWTVPTPDTFRGKFRRSSFPEEDLGWMYASTVHQTCLAIAAAGKKVGPFIAESLCCAGGHLTLPPRFLTEVYRTVRAHGGVCIADETRCGLGRTGKSMWAFQSHDPHLVPDIVTVGKSLGNGHPLAAVVTTKEIAKKFTNFVSYYNFLGDPLSCAVGLAVLDQLLDCNNVDGTKEGRNNKLRENVIRVGEYLKSGLVRISSENGRLVQRLVGAVTGEGLCIGVDFVRGDKEGSVEPHAELAQVVRQKLFERRVIVSVCGAHRNVIGFTPAYTLTVEDCDFILDRFKDTMQEVSTGPQGGGKSPPRTSGGRAWSRRKRPALEDRLLPPSHPAKARRT